MKLKLVRRSGTVGFTHGKLYIDGVFFCDTLEDQERKVKIAGITAIFKGVYKVILNMSNRFKRIMPLLLDVPEYTGIRIHAGQTAKHTEGCILVGKYAAEGYIIDSRDTFKRLMTTLTSAVKRGQAIEITIE